MGTTSRLERSALLDSSRARAYSTQAPREPGKDSDLQSVPQEFNEHLFGGGSTCCEIPVRTLQLNSLSAPPPLGASRLLKSLRLTLPCSSRARPSKSSGVSVGIPTSSPCHKSGSSNARRGYRLRVDPLDLFGISASSLLRNSSPCVLLPGATTRTP